METDTETDDRKKRPQYVWFSVVRFVDLFDEKCPPLRPDGESGF
jgi:hypothetical protein